VISRNPVTIQLRYLQTLLEMGSNQSSTIVFPLPLDLVQPLLKAIKPEAAAGAPDGPADEAATPALEPAPDAASVPASRAHEDEPARRPRS